MTLNRDPGHSLPGTLISSRGHVDLRIWTNEGGEVNMRSTHPLDSTFEGEDLANALERELGWTIITEPLPEVTYGKTVEGLDGKPARQLLVGEHVFGHEDDDLAARRRAHLAEMAVTRHLEQHPWNPVDPKVEKLAAIFREIKESDFSLDAEGWAQALLERGVQVPE